VSFWVGPSTTAWEKGLAKCDMSASQVLNAPVDHLAPNDALQDPNFCNQCKYWKLIALNVLLKLSHDSRMPEKAVLPQTHLISYAPNTRHLIRFARNGSIQRSPHPRHRLSFRFGIFICDRNSSTC